LFLFTYPIFSLHLEVLFLWYNLNHKCNN
jgi:hypothetical protein